MLNGNESLTKTPIQREGCKTRYLNVTQQYIFIDFFMTSSFIVIQVASLEYENKDLIERRHRNEASLLTLTDEVKRGQAEIQKLNQEIHSVRAESNRAGEGAKELDQTVHRLQAQVSALEQARICVNCHSSSTFRIRCQLLLMCLKI